METPFWALASCGPAINIAADIATAPSPATKLGVQIDVRFPLMIFISPPSSEDEKAPKSVLRLPPKGVESCVHYTTALRKVVMECKA